jgi:hypothetical protein
MTCVVLANQLIGARDIGYVSQELTRDPSFDPCQVISVVNHNYNIYNIVSAIPCVLLTAQE